MAPVELRCWEHEGDPVRITLPSLSRREANALKLGIRRARLGQVPEDAVVFLHERIWDKRQRTLFELGIVVVSVVLCLSVPPLFFGGVAQVIGLAGIGLSAIAVGVAVVVGWAEVIEVTVRGDGTLLRRTRHRSTEIDLRSYGRVTFHQRDETAATPDLVRNGTS